MNTRILTATVLAAFAGTAFADTKDDIKAAAKKLAEAENYTWRTTTDMGPDSRFTPGPVDGKTNKSGVIFVTMSFGNNTAEAYVKGDKSVSKVEGAWKTEEELAAAAEASGDDRPRGRRGFGRGFRGITAPAAQIDELLAGVESVEGSDGTFTGNLTEDAAKNLLSFRRGNRGNRDGNENRPSPEISGASGTVRFVLKDGVLAQLETHVKGSFSFNGQTRDIDRKTTSDITDVGTTKIDVPAEAAAKLGLESADEPKKEA